MKNITCQCIWWHAQDTGEPKSYVGSVLTMQDTVFGVWTSHVSCDTSLLDVTASLPAKLSHIDTDLTAATSQNIRQAVWRWKALWKCHQQDKLQRFNRWAESKD